MGLRVIGYLIKKSGIALEYPAVIDQTAYIYFIIHTFIQYYTDCIGPC